MVYRYLREDSMRKKAIIISLCMLVSGIAYLKHDLILRKLGHFYYHNLHTKYYENVAYKRRASYADMDKALRGSSFKSFVTEHYVAQSTATPDKIPYYDKVYFSCLEGAWLYIEGTKYKPTERIKPKIYEVLCIPEETDLYVAYKKKIQNEHPDWAEEKVLIDVLSEVARHKKMNFYRMYGDLFANPDLVISS